MKFSILKKYLLLIVLIYSSIPLALAKVKFEREMIENAKKAIVNIKEKSGVHEQRKPYYSNTDEDMFVDNSFGIGTGCIVSKAEGYIVTTSSVRKDQLYQVVFFDDSYVDAKFVYAEAGIAILKVDPKYIPCEASVLQISEREPSIGEVFVTIFRTKTENTDEEVKHNELSLSYVIDTGSIIESKNSGISTLDTHYARKRLNSKKSDSMGNSVSKSDFMGSPIINKKGELLALHAYKYCSVNEINIDYSIGAQNAEWIRGILQTIKKSSFPIPCSIGVSTQSTPMDTLVRYRQFPVNNQIVYNQLYQSKEGAAVELEVITYIIPGSPAEGILQEGDIIWEVNKEIAKNGRLQIHKAEQVCRTNTILLGVYRDGVFNELEVPLYNMRDYAVNKMVFFGGAYFFEADTYWSYATRVPLKTVCCARAIDSAIISFPSYSSVRGEEWGHDFAVQIIAIGGVKIKTLDDLIQAIPSLIKRKHFSIYYRNLLHIEMDGVDRNYNTCRFEIRDVDYSTNSPHPSIWFWNDEKIEWETTAIVME